MKPTSGWSARSLPAAASPRRSCGLASARGASSVPRARWRPGWSIVLNPLMSRSRACKGAPWRHPRPHSGLAPMIRARSRLRPRVRRRRADCPKRCGGSSWRATCELTDNEGSDPMHIAQLETNLTAKQNEFRALYTDLSQLAESENRESTDEERAKLQAILDDAKKIKARLD